MRAFFVGLIFLTAVAILTLMGFLLFPLLLAMAFLLRIVLGIILVLFAIWLLGEFIIFIWERIR
jgi:hypothetical protein